MKRLRKFLPPTLAFLLLAYYVAFSSEEEISTEGGLRGSANEVLEPAPDGAASSTSLIDIPSSVKEIVINVGSNLTPILPTQAMGPCAHAIAIEPIVGCDIPSHRQLSVINAAVSDKPGVMSMMKYNKNGLSSSLAKPSQEQYWNTNRARGDGQMKLVPVITLSSVIDAIPSTAKISLVKTDMQGFDFVAVKEAARALKERATHVVTEVWFDDMHVYRAENDFCRDWLPFMTELGYVLERTWPRGNDVAKLEANCARQLRDRPERPAVEASAGLNEGNAFWVREDAVGTPFPDCREIDKWTARFTEADYAACDAR